MAKSKNKKVKTRRKNVTVKLEKPMDFDEVMNRIVRVKPPQDKAAKKIK